MRPVFRNSLLVILAVLLITGYNSLFIVQQYEKALVLELGKPIRVEGPGLHFKLPFVQDIVYVDGRILNLDAPPQEAPTSDQKQVIVESFVKFRIVDPLKFYQTMQTIEQAQQRLGSVVNSSVRNLLGQVPLETILTDKRSQLMEQVKLLVDTEVGQFGIKIIDVRIKRMDLPEENSQAVFRRMQTQRKQEASRFRAEGERDALSIRSEGDKQKVLILANAQKQSDILRGTGDAEAAGIYSDAYAKNPQFFEFYRSLQSLRTSLTTDTTTFIGAPTGDFFRFFYKMNGK
ncbi:MAG TPA: protease modulator HflC [Alphaproteobacteria bacterium]|nr:protease modulator HflC [Alphaproteobacteria bacterium]